MAKYQFFTYPDNQIADFTYLNVDAETYQEEKAALITQRFQLDGAPITAKNAEEAVQKYTTNFSMISQEQAKATPLYALVMGIITLFKRIFSRRQA